MEHFKVNSYLTDGRLFLELMGAVDEDVDLTSLDIKIHTEVAIDWERVVSINSCGIREWIRWISGIAPTTQITFLNCPRVIVNQINMVDGFLPKSAKVQSFYVPYYCSSCESITPVLFLEGKHFSQEKITPPTPVNCSKCSKETEMDVVMQKYFRFLKRNL